MTVSKPRTQNGSHYFPFAPQGDESYSLILFQSSDQSSTTSFDYSYDCGPDDILNYPRPLTEDSIQDNSGAPQEEILADTPTPTASPTLQSCTYTSLINLFCRSGPGLPGTG